MGPDLERGRRAKESSFERARIFSLLTFSWIWPLFVKGKNDQISSIDDLEDLPSDDEAKNNADRLEAEFKTRLSPNVVKYSDQSEEPLVNGNKNVVITQNGKNVDAQSNLPHLRNAIQEVFGRNYFLVWIPLFVTDCLFKVVQPLMLLGFVRSFMTLGAPPDVSQQYFFAGAISLTTLCITITSNPSLFYLNRVTTRVKVALTSLIQRKMLNLSLKRHKDSDTTDATITNLISKDADVEDKLRNFPYIFIAPIQLAMFVYFLWIECGWSCLPGLFSILLYMPFQTWYSQTFAKYRGQISEASSARTSFLKEIIDGIIFVKSYAWEVFENSLNQRRKVEVKKIEKKFALHAFQMAVFLTSSRLIPFLTFISFALWGGPLTAEKVFFATAVYNTATHYMVYLLPGAFRNYGEFNASLQRIQTFLTLDEKLKNGCNGYNYNHNRGTNGPSLSLDGVSAKWGQDSTLDSLDINISGGKLVFVVGGVASGKSSFLQLLMGEFPLTSGKCNVNGKLAYCSQMPWVFNDSIKNNVLFNRHFDGNYEWALDMAVLSPDLRNLEQGDETILGDGGLGLSGGQRARVNYARALCQNADILLLDDPLSAVDFKTADSMVRNLKNDKRLSKTLRILVTNQTHFLPEADHIIVLEEGRIKAQGKYEALAKLESIPKTGNAGADVDSLVENGSPNANAAGDQRDENVLQRRPMPNTDEEISHGSVSWGTYLKYFKAAERGGQLTFHTIMFIISQLVITFIEYWIVLWTMAQTVPIDSLYEDFPTTNSSSNGNESLDLPTTKNITVNNDFTVDPNVTTTFGFFGSRGTMVTPLLGFDVELPIFTEDFYIAVYSILTALVFFTNLFKAVGFFNYSVKVCRRLHDKMVKCLLKAAPNYFNNKPGGEILNYFSKDIDVIDERIPLAFFNMLTIFLQIGSVIVLLVVANVWTVPAILVFLFLLTRVRKFYVSTSRVLKRLDGEARGNVVSQITTNYPGLATIRCAGAELTLRTEFDSTQDRHTKTVFLFTAASKCFDLWVESIAIFLLTLVTFAFPLAQSYFGTQFGGGNVGLAVCSALSFTIWLNYGMIVSAEVENSMISTERVMHFIKTTPQENYDGSPSLPDSWPETGRIEFENFGLRYSKDGRQILKDVTFSVSPREKIGVVGKTGAGKSSIFYGLLRFTDSTSGFVSIDGVDCRQVPLHRLRSSIAMVSQTPVIFQGKLQFNLDPTLDDQNVETLKSLIEEVDLKKKLDDELTAGGTNLSTGEQQKISLIRALFRLPQIRILGIDEATANIDFETEKRIQAVLKVHLQKHTVLTIAHRLETVIDCDKILVLENGNLKEFDTPLNLINNRGGLFRAMIDRLPEQKRNFLLGRVAAKQ